MHTRLTFAIALNKKFASQLKRYNYVTPKHYLDFISGYESKLNSQRTMIDDAIKRLSGGLDKLIQASAEVDAMREKLNEAQVVVNQQAVECDALLDRITKRTAEVEAKTTNALSKRGGVGERFCLNTSRRRKPRRISKQPSPPSKGGFRAEQLEKGRNHGDPFVFKAKHRGSTGMWSK